MTNIHEVPVQWHLPNGLEGLMVNHFRGTLGEIGDQRDALAACIATFDSNLVEGLSWTIPQEGKVLEAETGDLLGVWTDVTEKVGSGGASGQQVPDLAQVLVRWRTGAIRRNRLLQGRSFIPALNEGYVQAGNVSGALNATWTTAANALVDAGVGFGVWGRPLPAIAPRDGHPGWPALAGTFALATSASVWGEIASQRGRRG